MVARWFLSLSEVGKMERRAIAISCISSHISRAEVNFFRGQHIEQSVSDIFSRRRDRREEDGHKREIERESRVLPPPVHAE